MPHQKREEEDSRLPKTSDGRPGLGTPASLRVSFFRVTHDGSDAHIADVWIEDGQLRSTDQEFARDFGPMTVHGVDLTPRDGDKYLHGLCAKYGHGSYMRCEMKDSGDG